MGLFGLITLPLRVGKLVLLGRRTRSRNQKRFAYAALPVAGLSSDEHWEVLIRLQRLAKTPEVKRLSRVIERG